MTAFSSSVSLILLALFLQCCLTEKSKWLRCSTGVAFETFAVYLDNSGFDPNSGYYDPTNATIVDNYATAQLICVGNTPSTIDCVGFWFGLPGEVAEVTTKIDDNGNIVASYVSLAGSFDLKGGPWPCDYKM